MRKLVVLAMLLLGALTLSGFGLPVMAQNSTGTPLPGTPIPITLVPTVMFGEVFPSPVPQATIAGPVLSLSGVTATPVNRNVNIRSGPGTEYDVVRVLRSGRVLDVVGTNGYDQTRSCAADFNSTLDMWIVVQWGGQRGWVARCAVVVTGDMSRLLVHAAP